MSKLKEIYSKADDKKLVEIMESPQDYTPECVQVVKDEIQLRELDETSLKSIANKLMTKKVEKIIQNFSPINDKLVLPKSAFLNDDEIKTVFKQVFDEMASKREDMQVDSWKYVIGAFV